MKIRILGILGGIALLLSAGSVYAGGRPPKPVKVFGTEGCSSINAPITFDGVNYATYDTCTGHDNFGNYSRQKIDAYLAIDPSTGAPITGPPCTLPDGTAGEVYPLEFAEFVNTYNFSDNQIFGYSFTGSACSGATGSFSISNEFTILGGTGRFTGATGTVTQKASVVVGYLYYFNQPFPPYNLHYGSFTTGTGWFAQATATETGTITP